MKISEIVQTVQATATPIPFDGTKEGAYSLITGIDLYGPARALKTYNFFKSSDLMFCCLLLKDLKEMNLDISEWKYQFTGPDFVLLAKNEEGLKHLNDVYQGKISFFDESYLTGVSEESYASFYKLTENTRIYGEHELNYAIVVWGPLSFKCSLEALEKSLIDLKKRLDAPGFECLVIRAHERFTTSEHPPKPDFDTNMPLYTYHNREIYGNEVLIPIDQIEI